MGKICVENLRFPVRFGLSPGEWEPADYKIIHGVVFCLSETHYA